MLPRVTRSLQPSYFYKPMLVWNLLKLFGFALFVWVTLLVLAGKAVLSRNIASLQAIYGPKRQDCHLAVPGYQGPHHKDLNKFLFYFSSAGGFKTSCSCFAGSFRVLNPKLQANQVKDSHIQSLTKPSVPTSRRYKGKPGFPVSPPPCRGRTPNFLTATMFNSASHDLNQVKCVLKWV